MVEDVMNAVLLSSSVCGVGSSGGGGGGHGSFEDDGRDGVL